MRGKPWTPEYKKAYCRAYYQKHKESQRAAARARYNHEENHTYQIRRAYGMTKDVYNSILEAQGGECAICEARTTNRRTNKLSVDHNHETKQTRGLLCAKCNLIIGLCGEDTNVLINAANYLKLWAEEQAA